MIIDSKTLQKILYIFINQYIHVLDFKLDIEDVIKIDVLLDIYQVKTSGSFILKPYIDNDIIIDIQGTLKYGNLHVDFYKLLNKYINTNHIQLKDHKIIISNKYVKNIYLKNNHVELEF